MEQKIKHEIIKMGIPIIGLWWVIKRIIPGIGKITWWDTSNRTPFIIITFVLYQMICWIGWKVFYMMYFFNYTFEQVFRQW